VTVLAFLAGMVVGAIALLAILVATAFKDHGWGK
jgi:hypothetical protein